MRTYYIVIGLFTEGSTDIRFLESVVKRTFEEIAFHCKGEIDIDICPVKINKTGLTFIEQIEQVSGIGCRELGTTIMCIHADADDSTDMNTFNNKIIPAQVHLNTLNENDHCKIMAPIVPIYMTESWMLADTPLLKRHLGTTLPDNELNIHKHPETIVNPKRVIEDAIRISREHIGKRHRKDLQIKDLYLPLGQQIELSKLQCLRSYQKFRDSAVKSFQAAGIYLTD